MEEIGGEKPPDEKMSNFGERLNEKKWPGAEEVPEKPSWAQILGGQVSDNEVMWFEKEFSLMVPGEGAVAKMTGNDYVIREKYLKDLTEIIKENDEEKAKMGVLHFKVVEVDEEGNKVNYTEGETNEQMAMKDEAAMRLVATLCGAKWKISIKGANIPMIGDSYYVELEEKIKI